MSEQDIAVFDHHCLECGFEGKVIVVPGAKLTCPGCGRQYDVWQVGEMPPVGHQVETITVAKAEWDRLLGCLAEMATGLREHLCRPDCKARSGYDGAKFCKQQCENRWAYRALYGEDEAPEPQPDPIAEALAAKRAAYREYHEAAERGEPQPVWEKLLRKAVAKDREYEALVCERGKAS